MPDGEDWTDRCDVDEGRRGMTGNEIGLVLVGVAAGRVVVLVDSSSLVTTRAGAIAVGVLGADDSSVRPSLLSSRVFVSSSSSSSFGSSIPGFADCVIIAGLNAEVGSSSSGMVASRLWCLTASAYDAGGSSLSPPVWDGVSLFGTLADLLSSFGDAELSIGLSSDPGAGVCSILSEEEVA